MTPAPLPVDERFQLDALDALDLLDSGPDPDFDAIVALGRRLLDVPICLVTLVAAERQWFKANAGLAATETGRDVSFCGHAILKPEILVVPDARRDERFHDNPLVTGAPFIRFYAGAPIRLPNGYTVGTVCAISPEPREGFAPEDAALLDGLARLALGLISVRGLRRELDRERAERQRALGALDLLDAPVAPAGPGGHADIGERRVRGGLPGVSDAGRAGLRERRADTVRPRPGRLRRRRVAACQARRRFRHGPRRDPAPSRRRHRPGRRRLRRAAPLSAEPGAACRGGHEKGAPVGRPFSCRLVQPNLIRRPS